MHLGIPLAICPHCGRKLFTKEKLRTHGCLQDETREKKKTFVAPNHKVCRFCGITFETVEANRNHNCPYLIKDNPKRVICRFCNKNISKNDYGHHMERHKGVPNECHICHQKFMYKKGLKNHMNTHLR